MFATNPAYRWQNLGEFNMLVNSILNFNDYPAPPAPQSQAQDDAEAHPGISKEQLCALSISRSPIRYSRERRSHEDRHCRLALLCLAVQPPT